MRTRPTPGVTVRVLAPITLDHIALQVELLLCEVRSKASVHEMGQPDIDRLHRLVARCVLFIDSGDRPPR